MSTSINRLIDAIIFQISLITDYIVLRKHVTLSEMTLFGLSALRAVWYVAFGVQLGNLDGTILSSGWTIAFVAVAAVHFGSFFFGTWARIIAVLFQAFLWCFLSLLVAMHDFTTPMVPAFFVWSMMAVFIAVKLMGIYRREADEQIG